MRTITLEDATYPDGFITDGDWIESKDQDPTGDIRLIQLADIGDGEFLDKSLKFVNRETADRLNCTLLKEGDVLIARMPDPLGRSCIFPKLPQQAITAVDICIVRPNSDFIDREWLSYKLNSPQIRAVIQGHAQGATRARVPTGKLKKVEIEAPSLEQQRQIAARLKAQLAEVDKARQAAEVQSRDVSLLRSRALKGIFAELESEPKKTLGDHATCTSGSTPVRGNKQYWQPAEIPWVKTGEVVFAPITETEEAVSKTALDECSLTLLPPDTVLIAMYGQGKTRGQSAILKVPATTNQACFAVLPNDTWEPDFLFLWLKSSYQDLRALSEDRGGNQANLNGGMLKALEAPAPERCVQLTIVQKIKAALKEIDDLEKASKVTMAEITQLPNKLLAQAFEM